MDWIKRDVERGMEIAARMSPIQWIVLASKNAQYEREQRDINALSSNEVVWPRALSARITITGARRPP